MSAFFDWFFAYITTMIDGVWKIISGIPLVGTPQVSPLGATLLPHAHLSLRACERAKSLQSCPTL